MEVDPIHRVVFILSTNYAGSHLLSHLLGAHARCFALGELRNLNKLLTRSRSNRDVVGDYERDPIFANLTALPAVKWHGEILARLAANRPRVDTLIDNSKRIEWAARHSRHADFEPRFVHLLRDPRALVFRWLSMNDTASKRKQQKRRTMRHLPWRALTLWRAPMEQIYLEKWLHANRRISQFLGAHAERSCIVCYRDLAQQTTRALAWLMPRVGLEFEESQLEYGRIGRYGTLKVAHSDQTALSKIDFDARWTTGLAQDVQDRIADHAAVGDYLQGNGVSMLPDGLSNIAAG